MKSYKATGLGSQKTQMLYAFQEAKVTKAFLDLCRFYKMVLFQMNHTSAIPDHCL